MPTLEIERHEQTMQTQAELLRLQLLEMKAKGLSGSPIYYRGVGRLEAILWVIKNPKAPTSLMYSNKEIQNANEFWGMF
jgi:hypothetical protein